MAGFFLSCFFAVLFEVHWENSAIPLLIVMTLLGLLLVLYLNALRDPLLKARFWRKATAQDVDNALEQGSSPHALDADFEYRPLHVAAGYGRNPQAVQRLLERGVNLQVRDSEGKTFLHWAAQYNKIPEVVTLLLEQGANIINEQDKQGGMMPLHFANTSKIVLFLDHGANINCQNDWGMTPLHIAAKFGNLANIKLLLDKGADGTILDAKEKTPFDYAKKRLSKKSELYQRLNKARFP